jgi:phosphomannomutase
LNAVSLTVRDLMQESGVAFGTSGARGLVSALTDRVAYGYAAGFLSYLAEIGEFKPGGEVAFAGDLRPSTPRILAASAQAIRDAGGAPVFCGYVPTPALAVYAFSRGIPSLMVTGSHIPDDRNGVKYHRARGEFSKADEAGMARQTVRLPGEAFDDKGGLVSPTPLPPVRDVEAGYLARYRDFFGAEALKGLTVGVYQHSAVGRDLIAAILAALGAEVVPLGRSERFVPVDTEALRPEDVALGRQWAGERRLDAIASTDGDSDRPLLADARGVWLRGDILSLLCARELKADCVVTPVSSNTAVEACGAFARVLRTRIGSPYVIEGMHEAASAGRVVCGYEANGGFLLESPVTRDGRTLTALPTRDAALPIVAVLAAARRRPLADLSADLPARVTWSDRLKDFPTADSQAILAYLREGGEARIERHFAGVASGLTRIDETDGLRLSFADGAVVHLRPSGNAPELRCYTEAASEDEARRLNAAALALAGGELARTVRSGRDR